MDQTSHSPEPPGLPPTQERFRPRPLQLLGMLLIAVIPTLALLGVFGENYADANAAGADLELHVRYPQRVRYKTIDPLEIRVRNVSGQAVGRVVVSIDESYLSQFSGIRITPSADKAYEVELKDLQPGEERLVSLEIQGEQYGRHHGQVTAATDATRVAVPVKTFTFP